MEVVSGIELTEAGALSFTLKDLLEYGTLAFVASFDAHKLTNKT